MTQSGHDECRMNQPFGLSLAMRSVLTTLVIFAALISAASARDYKVGALEIADPWTRASSGQVAGGFLKITNKGSQADRLIGGSLDNADKVEVHETTMENSVAKMRPVAGGIAIKPGETVELKPGSFHIMFMGLKQPTKRGRQDQRHADFRKGRNSSRRVRGPTATRRPPVWPLRPLAVCTSMSAFGT